MAAKSALDLYKESLTDEGTGWISFGCDNVDSAIGKLCCKGINEISGEAGSGKTQICLTLSLQTAMTGKAVAILSCGEGLFPIRRLAQLADCIEAKTKGSISAKTLLSRIHIEQCENVDDAKDIINRKLPQMCLTMDFKLFIIDSMAGLIRFEYNTNNLEDMIDRTTFLFSISRQLKWLSDTFRMGILIVNQVTANMNENSIYPMREADSIPALGLVWSHCVNTRFKIEKTTHSNYSFERIRADDSRGGFEDDQQPTKSRRVDSSSSTGARRVLTLVSSPYRACSSCAIELCTNGIFGNSYDAASWNR